MDARTLLPALLRAARHGPDRVLDALEAPLREAGLSPRATRAQPRAVLWSRGDARLCLSGHVDVVPVGDGWTRDPFGGEAAEGRVWGRGASDMLGAVACFAAAAARAPDAPCAVLLTTDEETTMRAAQHALDEGLLAGVEGVVVGEPTGMALGIAEKGVLWTRLTTRGRNAHGSMPELGDNAADRLVRVLARLQGAAMPGEHPALGRATRSLGVLRAGEAVNQVPASASAEIDVRYLPGTPRDDVLAALRRAAAEAGEAVEIEVLSDHLPFEQPPDAPLVRLVRDAVARATGRAPPLVGLPYGTEASKLAPRGIPCVIWGPGEQGLAHTSRESVALDALDAAEAAYAAMLRAAAEQSA